MFVRTYPGTYCTRVPWYHTLFGMLYCASITLSGKLVVGFVSIEDITVCYGSNSTARSAAQISTTILASMYVHVYHGTKMVPWYACRLYTYIAIRTCVREWTYMCTIGSLLATVASRCCLMKGVQTLIEAARTLIDDTGWCGWCQENHTNDTSDSPPAAKPARRHPEAAE
jgi:hypothetical protein